MAAVGIGQYHVPPFAAPGAHFSCVGVFAVWASNTNAFTVNSREFVLTPAYGARGSIASWSCIPNRVAADGALDALLPLTWLGIFAAIADIASIDTDDGRPKISSSTTSAWVFEPSGFLLSPIA